jgi:uncharacterized membrane protein YvbJ
MKLLSASAAAKVAHKSKADILDSIKKGVMSASKNKRGHWEIDPSELNRVFPYAVSEPNQSQFEKPLETNLKTIETNALQVEVKMLREQLDFRDEVLAELRQERDDWKVQAKTLLIAKQDNHEARRGLFSMFRKRP